jgi:hypothetical protein
MLSARTQLRLVVLFYTALGILGFARIAAITYLASSSQPSSPAHDMAQRATSTFPLGAVFAIFHFALAGLSFRFLKLASSWRMAAIAGSIFLGLLHITRAVRGTLSVVTLYEDLGGRSSIPMAIQFAVLWGSVLAFALCAYVLWKALRDARAKGQGERR